MDGRAATRRRYRDSNREKIQCHAILNRAVTRGDVVRPGACERCGAPCTPDGHHGDYSQPLQVVWLCRSCHVGEHPEVYGPRERREAERMDLLVQDVPAKVLSKLTADARRRDVSINDAAAGILAERYGVERASTGVGFKHGLTRQTLLLTLPDELHQRIKVDAASRKGVTMRGLIIGALAAHYKVTVPSQGRRPRGTAAAAAR